MEWILSLIAVDATANIVEYSGAMNPIYIVSSGQLTEIKADRHSIGKGTDSSVKFTNHEIKFHKGDEIYLFSDGFEDQFGGANGKKFKASRMKELLTSLASLDMQKQYESINKTFEQWKGNLDQVDDVLVIGHRF